MLFHGLPNLQVKVFAKKQMTGSDVDDISKPLTMKPKTITLQKLLSYMITLEALSWVVVVLGLY